MKQLRMAAVLFSLCGAAWAQSATTGKVFGTVHDAAGAVVPGAAITLTSATGQQRTVQVGGQGEYSFPNIDPGHYTLTATRASFALFTVKDVIVEVTISTEIDPVLSPAGTATTVTVSAEAPLLSTASATTGRVIDEQVIRDLPLPTRNFQQLLGLSPGTNIPLTVNTELGRGDIDLNVNGQQATANNVIIDGIYANSIGTGSTPNLAVPSPDAIDQFIVQTSLYDATTGRNTGGNLALITKSGGNSFHGTAYDFARDTIFNANDYLFKSQGLPRGTLNRNVFGATIGGPIIRDKAFFFLSYQGQRERNSDCLSSCFFANNVPAGLTNDRSTAAITALQAEMYAQVYNPAIYGPTIPVVNPSSLALLQATFPDGQFVIPSAPAGAAATGPTDFVTVFSRGLSTFRDDQFDANFDYNLGTHDHLSAKFFSENSPLNEANFSFLGANANQVPGFGGPLNFRNRLLSLNETHTFSSNFLNDARFGFSRIRGISVPNEPFTNAQFGIANPLAGQFPGLSTIGITGEFTLGPTSLQDERSITETFQWSDYMTWTRGDHTFRWGLDIFRNHTDFDFNAFSRGEIIPDGFTPQQNFAQFVDGGLNFAANPQLLPVADAVIGLLGNGVPDRYLRTLDGDIFFQDDWRVTPTFTLNAGVRVSRFGGISEIKGRLVNFNPATFLANNPAGCSAAAPCDAPENGFDMLGKGDTINPDTWNGAPRVGFAWQPGTLHRMNMVIRGGYGLYYDRTSSRIANLQIFNYPYDVVGAALGSINAPFPNLAGLTFPLAPVVPATIPETYYGTPIGPQPISGYYVSPNFTAPYDQQYGLNVQIEPVHNWLLEVGYVGSKGTRGINVYTANQPGSANSPVLSASGFSGNKAFNGLEVAVNNGIEHYDSLQASLTKRMDKHLQFLASYTYSHALDNGSGSPENELAALPGDQQNFDTQYGSSDFDRRQRFVLSGLYDLGRLYNGSSGVASQVVNGWQLASIMTFQTGTPFSVLCAAGSTLNSRANYLGGDPYARQNNNSKLAEYFNTQAFGCGAPYDTTPLPSVALPPFGLSGRNMLVGPGQADVDMSVFKHFPIREQMNLEFRAEFFNIGNWANFGNPNNNLLAANPGEIQLPGGGPRVIQFALKFNY